MVPVSLYNGMKVNFFCVYLHYITSVKYFNIWLNDICNFTSFCYIKLLNFINFSSCHLASPLPSPGNRETVNCKSCIIVMEGLRSDTEIQSGWNRLAHHHRFQSDFFRMELRGQYALPNYGPKHEPGPCQTEAEAAGNSARVLDTCNY